MFQLNARIAHTRQGVTDDGALRPNAVPHLLRKRTNLEMPSGSNCASMKLINWIVLAVTSIASISALASEPKPESGISFFEGTLEGALDHAKQEGLPLFVDLSIPDCAPCEFMATEVWVNPTVGKFMNDRFVCIKVDAYDKETNGSDIAIRYSVGSYPTYLILDHDGKEKHRATSSMTADNFIRAISWLIGETDSPMEDFDAKYEAGVRDPDFVQQYLLLSTLELSLMPKDTANWEANMEAYGNAIDKYTAIANEYLDGKPSRDLINSADLSIIKKYSQYRSDKGIEIVVDNFDAYVEATSLEEVSKFLLGIITDEAFIKAMQGDSTYVDLIDSMDEDPLKRAAAFERERDPESRLLPENQRDYLEETFSSAASPESSDTRE